MILELQGVRAIIFDMDGVLFLSSDCHEKAFRAVLAEHGIAEFSYASIAGMRTDDSFRKIFSKHGRTISDADLYSLINKKRSHAIQMLETEGKIAEDSEEMIHSLKGKYRMCVASSASPQTVALFLSKSNYADVFEFCLNGVDVEHAKPEPDIYQLAVRKLGLLAKECVVIEDSMNGIEAAVAAGIPVIGLVPNSEHMALQNAGAIAVLPNLQAIGKLLTSCYKE